LLYEFARGYLCSSVAKQIIQGAAQRFLPTMPQQFETHYRYPIGKPKLNA
jgi:hypothetical protein